MKLFIKKFLLIVVGIFLSLILLELGLRLAGWTISYYQQYKNNKALQNKSQYTIMCLGESTTAEQYPIQLQQILDKKYLNKFSVIDCSISGITLENILNLLDNNINKYHPDIAICMMGINNGFVIDFDDENVNLNYIKQNKKINLKIFKLCLLIKQHLTTILQKKNVAFAKETSGEKDLRLENVSELINIGKYKEVAEILKKILKDNPNNEFAFVNLAILYHDFLDKTQELGYNMAVKALEKNFNYKKDFYYKIIFEKNFFNKDVDSFKYYVEKAIKEDSAIFLGVLGPYLYGYIKNYITPEQKDKILKIMTLHNKKFQILAIDALEQKDYQKAQEYFDKAEEIRLNFPNEKTYISYKLILKKLIDNSIKVICMQYPIRSILPLQEQLKNEPYYDKIMFLSNEELFKEALMNKNYNEVFNDQFAGDFGHCTELGNTMIAENIVSALENILDLKQN